MKVHIATVILVSHCLAGAALRRCKLQAIDYELGSSNGYQREDQGVMGIQIYS